MGNLTKATRVRLTSAVRCAIRMRSNQKKKNAAKLLEKDIRNSVHHIFGNHKTVALIFAKFSKVILRNIQITKKLMRMTKTWKTMIF